MRKYLILNLLKMFIQTFIYIVDFRYNNYYNLYEFEITNYKFNTIYKKYF